jgi:vacuolar-type H+-ATPase subunit I/STV1
MADTDYDIDDMLDELDAEEKHEEVIETAEGKADKEDSKAPVKARNKVEEKLEKFEQNALREAIERFEDKSDDLEKELFAAARAEVKTLDEFYETVDFVKSRAGKFREREEKLAEEAAKRAEEKAAKSWGVGPVGNQTAPSDADKEVMERIAAGDTDALFESLVTLPPVR